MNKRAIYIMFIVAALLIVSTACTVRDVPSAKETQPMEEVLTVSPTESDTPTPEQQQPITVRVEQEPSPMREEEPLATSEQEPSQTPKEDMSIGTLSTSKGSTGDTYDDYFVNSVFVGDSVMEGFAQYIRTERKQGGSVLSDAQFLTSVMGVKVADIVGDTPSNNRRHYTYRGKEQPLETILKDMGVERVFIMLGMNDLGVGSSAEETIERYREMILLLKETSPDLDVIVMTTTPKTATKWLPSYIPNKNFGSPLLNEFADMLKVMCEEDGIKYVDINAVVRGPNGHLPNEYSRDDFVHINGKCSEVVLETMRQFAKIQVGG